MKYRVLTFRCQQAFRTWKVVWLVCLGLIFCQTLPAVQPPIEILRANHQVYRQVEIQNRTATHIFFKHANGIASVRITNLCAEALYTLGMGPNPAAAKASISLFGGNASGTNASALPITIPPEVWEKTVALTKPVQDEVLPVIMKMLNWVIAFTILAHLFSSFCFMLICQKAGKPGGFLVWVPLFQWVPLFKAARMSPWNFLLLFLPIINVIVLLMWCLNIAKALEKHPLVGLMLFLPVTNIIALLYMAFSYGPNDEEASPVIKMDFAPSTTE